MKLLRGSVVGVAGLVGAGVIAWPAMSTATAADSTEVYLNRDEQAAELVLVGDDDDDDSNDNTNTNNTQSRFTGFSRATNDNTRSNVTRVSRDRDRSRSDKTRDWTRDGGSWTRDWSANTTNDRSRNDTRGRR